MDDMGGSITLIQAAEDQNLVEILTTGLAYAILFAGLLSVVFIFMGGISFILSGGKDEKIKQALGTIRYSIIGLLISIFSIFIVSMVGKVIGVDVVQYIKPAKIFSTIKQLTNNADSNNDVNSLD